MSKFSVLLFHIHFQHLIVYSFYNFSIFFPESYSKPRYTPHILGRRFALTATSYKYLDIGISVGPVPL